MLRKKLFLIFVLALLSLIEPAAAKILKLADFNDEKFFNNVGGQFGAWERDPADNTQGCLVSFTDKESYGGKGFSLYIDYDVDSPNPAYNGFWMKLGELDAREYNQLVFYIKGDVDEGFTSVLKVELKNPQELGRVKVSGINENWQKVVIPFSNFVDITNWQEMTEFVIVFDDLTVDKEVGAIYIDEIYFSDGKAETSVAAASKTTSPTIKQRFARSGLLLETRDKKTVIVLPTNFINRSADLVEQDKVKIDKVAQILKDFPKMKMSIEAHTDFLGRLEGNFVLSRKRAEAVKQYLVSQHHIDPNRLFTKGWGETEPIATNLTTRGRAKNRRIEFVIIENDDEAKR